MTKYSILYTPKFVSILGYMLQSVEYDTRIYLKWFWQQRDFRTVANKRISPTSKSRLVVLLGTILYLALLVMVVWLWYRWLSEISWPQFMLASAATALMPVAMSLGMAVIAFVGRLILQKPLEWIRRRSTRRIFDEHQAKIIVIAGSYGKTSMKHLLSAVLGAKLKVAATPGNYNTPAGIGRYARNLNGDEDVLIIEAGEYRPGDVAQICSLVGPDIGFITGVNEQHMWHMKSVENALRTIFELTECLDKNAPLYINRESAYIGEHIQPKDLAYSRAGVGKVKVTKRSTNLSGTNLTLKHSKASSFELKTSLMGLHQVGPIAAVSHLAMEFGLKPTDIKRGLEDMEAHNRRFKPQEISGVTVIDDTYNGNPDGFLAGIEFMDGLKRTKRRVYVTPGMIELGRLTKPVHLAIGERLASSKFDQVYLYDNPATRSLAEGLEQAGYKGKLNWLNEEDIFLEHATELTKKGDIVLLQNSPREPFFYL